MDDTLAHIAIVDDEPDLRRAVAAYLSKRGCRVTDLPDAASLRSLLTRERVDLVLLDINMPGENGLSLAAWLRKQQAGEAASGREYETFRDELADDPASSCAESGPHRELALPSGRPRE